MRKCRKKTSDIPEDGQRQAGAATGIPAKRDKRERADLIFSQGSLHLVHGKAALPSRIN